MPNIEITATANVKPVVDGLIEVRKEVGKTVIESQKLTQAFGTLSSAVTRIPAPFANSVTGIKAFNDSLVKAKSAISDFGGLGPRAIAPLSDRLKGLKFPGVEADVFNGKIKELGTSFIKSHAQTLIFGAVMAGIGVATAAASYWLKIVAKDFTNAGTAAEDVGKKIKEYNDLVKSVTESVAKETTEVIGLLAVLKSETETRDRKLAAIKELQKIQPEIFNGLRLEKDAVIGLDEAYVSYIANLKNVIAAKILQAQIEKKVTELLTIQGAANTKEQAAQLESFKKGIAASKTLSEIKKNLQDTKLAGGFLTDKQSAERVAKLNEEIQSLFEKLSEFTKSIKVKEIKVKPEKVTIDTDEIDKLPFRTLSLLDDKTPTLTTKPLVLVQPEIKFIPNTDQQDKALQDFLNDIKALEIGTKISAILTDSINQGVSSLADSFAGILNGTKNGFNGLFEGLASTLANGLKEIGKYLVQTYLLIGEIEKIKFSNPAVGVAVGFALQVLGSLIQSKIRSTPAFATGVRNFEGGFATVGERGPERIFLPTGSSVQPNNEMSAYGGGREIFIPAVTLNGSDLVISFNRASQQMGRNN